MNYSKSLVLFLFLSVCFINESVAEALVLNDKEKNWLAQHPVIRIAFDKSSPPFESINKQGFYEGIAIDKIELIEKKLNIKFKQVESGNWSRMLDDFKAGRIDILPALAQTDKRQKYMLFTQSHVSIPGVIISSEKYTSIQELDGKKVGVVSDFIWDELVTQHDENINIIRVETTQMGIELVSVGVIDAMVSDLASVTYFINKDGIGNLQIVPVSGKQRKNMDLAIGIRKDWPVLQQILQKSLDSLERKDIDSINDKWLKLKPLYIWQSGQFWIIILFISLIIISTFALIIYWNRSLKLQVSRRSKQLEKAYTQLIHAEKMESIGRLSAGIAHEVKNPLAILQMSLDYLKGEDNNETIITILDDMDDAIVRADKVIKGLLDFSREKELQVTQGNINEVIEKSLQLVGHELKQRNIQLQTLLTEDLPDLGMDRNRLQQVFINLFMNAAQAIGNSGKIIVSSSRGKIEDPLLLEKTDSHFSLNDNVVIIEILDTGCGLDKKHEKDVFEPFFTTKPVGEGTGLGLSVSKTIIGLHHGMITMKNRMDDMKVKGVAVKIYFAINGEQNK